MVYGPYTKLSVFKPMIKNKPLTKCIYGKDKKKLTGKFNKIIKFKSKMSTRESEINHFNVNSIIKCSSHLFNLFEIRSYVILTDDIFQILFFESYNIR